ncbi:MAG: DUF2147 domain-containing protein, partial [Bacteroidales bacterium]
GTYFIYEESTNQKSKVKIFKNSEGKYDAQVIWMDQPNMPDGTPKKDFKNPKPELRNGRADRIVIVQGLVYNPKTLEWEGGKVYNPLNGKYYKGYMEFIDAKKLKVRGYLGIALLGKTIYWEKIE